MRLKMTMDEYLGGNVERGVHVWTTFYALIFILISHLCFLFFKRFSLTKPNHLLRKPHLHIHPLQNTSTSHQQFRVSDIISDADLKALIDNLDGNHNVNEQWENVVDKNKSLLSYNAKCCRPKDGPLKYISGTIFENCTTEMLRDFYMDNEYRKQWDQTIVDHEQLHIDETNGTEIGRTIKKFPLLTPREYVLAWKLWEGQDKSFYCFIKECEHPLAPQQKKYVRVGFFRSGWRIRKVPGRNACEIKMVHQEDAGLNVEFAKLAFSKGIWSYVCKMDTAFRRYSSTNRPSSSPAVTAVTCIQKVPPSLETISSVTSHLQSETSTSSSTSGEANVKKPSRKPSPKSIAKGLLLLGGIICLSRGRSALGAKVAAAFILKKLAKHHPTSPQTHHN